MARPKLSWASCLKPPACATRHSSPPRCGPRASRRASHRWRARWPCCVPRTSTSCKCTTWSTGARTWPHCANGRRRAASPTSGSRTTPSRATRSWIASRGAEQRLLPLAAERGIAVLVNLPFGGGKASRALCGRPLPPWAAEIGCSSWNQVMLKFVLSHPAVTCAIPGTSNPAHMRENTMAGDGEQPGQEFWASRLPGLF